MAEKTGVDYPIDYHQDLSKSFRELGIDQVEYVAVLFDITRYFDQIKHLVRPFGHVGTIVGIKEPLDIGVWKTNLSVSTGSICSLKQTITMKSKRKEKL